MSSLAEMPDLCLIVIFDNLPLLDLIHIDEVCPRFGFLKEEACRHRKDLTLLLGDGVYPFEITLADDEFKDDSFYYGDISQLKLSTLTARSASQIGATFPNITTLKIAVEQQFELGPRFVLHQLVVMLETYSQQLITLKLYLNFLGTSADFYYLNEPDNAVVIRDLFQKLALLTGDMKELKSFTFDCAHNICVDEDFEEIDLPVLNRLEEFYFSTKDFADILIESLGKYGQSNTSLQQITLLNPIFDSQDLFLQLNRDFRDRFTILKINRYYDSPDNVKEIVPSFFGGFRFLQKLIVINCHNEELYFDRDNYNDSKRYICVYRGCSCHDFDEYTSDDDEDTSDDDKSDDESNSSQSDNHD